MSGGMTMRKRRSAAPETSKTKTKSHVVIEKPETMMVEIPLWLVGEVNDDSVKELVLQIDQINSSVKPENMKNTYITLNISSEGGDIYSGFALIDAIKNSQVMVHTHIASVAMSMAAAIFMAGSVRTCSKWAQMMIHHFSVGVVDTPPKNVMISGQSTFAMEKYYESMFKPLKLEENDKYLFAKDLKRLKWVSKII